MASAKKHCDQRKERLEARVTPEFKTQLLLACSITGKSVTDFVVEHLGQAAQEVIAEHTQWKLAQHDSEIFVEALLNPKSPSSRLTHAVQRHRQAIG